MAQTIPGWKARQRKREKAARVDPMEEVIFFLLQKGWQPAGRTSDAPVACGGKLVTFGGRRRFVLPGTPRICTVGKRTTCFYYIDDERKPIDFVTITTSDMEAVQAAALGSVRKAD